MEPLKFIVSPHIVQDLGLNLYTNLPRVLVEFVANAYDADSSSANILVNKERIDAEREKIKKELAEVKKDKTKNCGCGVRGGHCCDPQFITGHSNFGQYSSPS